MIDYRNNNQLLICINNLLFLFYIVIVIIIFNKYSYFEILRIEKIIIINVIVVKKFKFKIM